MIAAVAAAVATSTFAPGASAAPAAAPMSLFSCWTTPLSVVEKGEPTTNPDRQVCTDDQVAASQAADTDGPVKVSATAVAGSTTRTVARTFTTQAAGTEAARATVTESAVAKASAGSAKLTVGRTVIDLGAITSQTTISCTYGPSGARYSFSSKSSVGAVKINGKSVSMRNGPMDIKVNGGILRLNHARTTAVGVTQHAVMLTANGTDVVIGESAVAVSKAPKNPCRP